jgi:hypothetical protein
MCGARESRGKTARPVPAKVIAPEITGYFPRKRLFRLLDDARKRPVIWISAPPGSGKTTLVSSYIDARWLPRLWYQVDERDADVATFFYYLGLAAQRAAPRKRKPLPLLTPNTFPAFPCSPAGSSTSCSPGSPRLRWWCSTTTRRFHWSRCCTT